VQEEREKSLLDDFLAILKRQANAEEVTQQPVSQLAEEIRNLFFESRGLRRTTGADPFRKGQAHG
jgi:hypothetical protein